MAKSGESRRSLFGGHVNHYDASGRKTGESRQSLFGGHVNHYDASGRKTGESRQSLFGGHMNHYDASGRKLGESRAGLFGRNNHYDPSGRKIGESRRSLFGGHVDYYDRSFSAPVSPRDGLDPFGGPDDAVGHVGPADAPPSLVGGATSRVQLFAFYASGAVVGSLVAVAVSLAILVVAMFLRTVPAFGNLLAAITGPDGLAGPLMIVAWLIFCAVAAVVSQILYSRSAAHMVAGTIRGAMIGVVALLVFGMAGLADGWGQLIPVLGAGGGNVIGMLADWRGRRRAGSDRSTDPSLQGLAPPPPQG